MKDFIKSAKDWHCGGCLSQPTLLKTNVIFPDSKGKVYITDVPFSPEQAFNILFLAQGTHKGKSDYVWAFQLDRVQESMLYREDLLNPYEYIYRGTLKPINTIYLGMNPYK